MKLRNLLIVVMVLLAIYVVLLAVAELPPYGQPENPAHGVVSQRYVTKALEEAGVFNMVTAIVLDYRAYDTMFETIVLFTAVLAVVVTIKTKEGKGAGHERLYR
ncbi:MAG TPA: hypothetical protein GXX57_07295 [Firmicutes bacterium]|nr:hypothetical protein [Bacillota bacterium]